MSDYFREPKKVRTRPELEKSCRMLREHNEAQKGLISDLECDVYFWKTKAEELQAKLGDVERVIVDLDTQCTNAHAVKMLDKALGGYVPEPPHRTLSNGKIKDTLTGEVGEPFSRRIDED